MMTGISGLILLITLYSLILVLYKMLSTNHWTTGKKVLISFVASVLWLLLFLDSTVVIAMSPLCVTSLGLCILTFRR